MYEVMGFFFKEIDGEIKKYRFGNGLFAHNYDEVHEVMKEMKIQHYMFILKEVKE